MRRTSRPRRSSRSGGGRASSREAPATAKQETAAVIPSTHAIARGPGLPWYVAAGTIAATSAVVGVMWDISWHRSIGRDTFWTPAHLAIYLGGVLAGAACGWLVLRTTFSATVEEQAAGVTFWGFRGPLGAWVAIWGALAMLASGPFDNWWHNAYGLDVKVLSPPHVILALGFNPVPHMVAPPFPLLLVVPAAALDLLVQRFGPGRDWRLAVLAGVTFLGVFFVTQWFFTEFLLTPQARTFAFGVDQWDYSSRVGPWRYRFWRIEADPVTASGLAWGAVFAITSARLGLWWGNWMARVRR